MTACDSSAGGQAGPVPVACTLTTAGLAARSLRWEQFAARAMTGQGRDGGRPAPLLPP